MIKIGFLIHLIIISIIESTIIIIIVINKREFGDRVKLN